MYIGVRPPFPRSCILTGKKIKGLTGHKPVSGLYIRKPYSDGKKIIQ